MLYIEILGMKLDFLVANHTRFDWLTVATNKQRLQLFLVVLMQCDRYHTSKSNPHLQQSKSFAKIWSICQQAQAYVCLKINPLLFRIVTLVFCVSESDEFGTWHATPLEASQLGAWYEQVAPPFSTASPLATTSATPTTVPDDRTPT